MLELLVKNEAIKLQAQDIASILELKGKKWSFFVTKPTMQTQTLEMYLARYINKIAVGNSRIELLKKTKEVRLVYNDYKNQIDGEAAPKKYKTFNALSFIHQYMTHVPPPNFQRTRRYGLHSSRSRKSMEEALRDKIKNNGQTVRTTLEIITKLLKVSILSCQNCKHTEFDIQLIPKDPTFIFNFLKPDSIARSP